ncbi:MAG: aspartate dehydrogenase domain-containing protein [Burkholderiales bacterium]
MTPVRRRLGLIGFGFIGAGVYRRVVATPQAGLEIAFVHNRSRERLSGVAAEHILERLEDSAARRPDLVVEMAHPEFTRRYGASILAHADYLPLSVTALADDDLRERLVAVARASGHRLLLPHGALMACDNLVEWRDMWESVEITFRKHPRNIEFADSGFDVTTIRGETVVYDGPARGIARLYPRNVNTMITCALATVGLDRCRARLIADPSLEVAVAEVVALGRDGSLLTARKEQPATGVSGTEMFASQFHSICKAAGLLEPFDFV